MKVTCCGLMPIEEEMQLEIRRLERELTILDEELEKLHKRILNLLMIRKKKEQDLRVLKTNFYGELPEEKEWQTTLARLLREEGVKHLG